MLIKYENRIINTDNVVYADFNDSGSGVLVLHCLGMHGNGKPIIVRFEGDAANAIWNELSSKASDVAFIGIPPYAGDDSER